VFTRQRKGDSLTTISADRERLERRSSSKQFSKLSTFLLELEQFI
jgi:hypothetical protein